MNAPARLQMPIKERPRLFKAEMVRAILDSRKTQTRRIVKLQPDKIHDGEPYWNIGGYRAYHYRSITDPLRMGSHNPIACPHGKPGDRIWVKENWRTYKSLDHCRPSNIEHGAGIQYETHGSSIQGQDRLYAMGKLRPSLFMPRWASRILLEVTNVRVERLMDISPGDCLAEGIYLNPPTLVPKPDGFDNMTDAQQQQKIEEAARTTYLAEVSTKNI